MATVIREDPGNFAAAALAAAKITNLGARRKQMKVQNEIARGNLKANLQNARSLELQRISDLGVDAATESLRKAQTAFSEFRSKTEQQKATGDIVSSLIDIDPESDELSDSEASALVERARPALEDIKVPLDHEPTRLFVRDLFKADQSRQILELKQEERRSVSTAAAQLALAGSRVNAADAIELGMIESRINSLQDRKDTRVRAQDAVGGRPEKAGAKQDSFDAQTREIERIDQQIADQELKLDIMRRRIAGPQNQAQVPGNPSRGATPAPAAATPRDPSLDKFILVTNEEQFRNLRGEQNFVFIDPSGKRTEGRTPKR